jgi:hypothetical protein
MIVLTSLSSYSRFPISTRMHMHCDQNGNKLKQLRENSRGSLGRMPVVIFYIHLMTSFITSCLTWNITAGHKQCEMVDRNDHLYARGAMGNNPQAWNVWRCVEPNVSLGLATTLALTVDNWEGRDTWRRDTNMCKRGCPWLDTYLFKQASLSMEHWHSVLLSDKAIIPKIKNCMNGCWFIYILRNASLRMLWMLFSVMLSKPMSQRFLSFTMTYSI